jgi:plasmid stabilization system protein ParE
MNLRYTDRSKDDIEMAFAWYERQRKGLGFEFLDCLEASLQNIINSPEMYQLRYSCFRGCPIRRFPFSIFYSIEVNDIVIHSVFDNRQDPKKRP